MLPFQEQIVAELLDDPGGGLVVLSSGLSLQTLVSALLLLHSPSQGTLLILSASEPQKSSILRSLRRSLSLQDHRHQIPAVLSPIPADIPGDMPSHHRVALYTSGAAFFVSPRILIADLLTARCPPSALAGLIILNAHRLSDTSTESFIVRVLRSANRGAYVRAFSDSPQATVAGFAKAERTMRWLGVRRLHLWPRFQVQVSADLEGNPPEVVDVRVPMTAAMRGIQGAVVGAMDACLKELRRTNKVDVEDLTVENGLFKSFDEIVRRQLDPIWHTLGKKTKQLVADLRTLRKLADYLVREYNHELIRPQRSLLPCFQLFKSSGEDIEYDAVTYLKYLDTLRVSEGVRSVWIFADSSHKIFEFAKKRVYQVVRADGMTVGDSGGRGSKKRRLKEGNKEENAGNGERGTSIGVVLKEVLEEAPKWKVLRELLEEIEDERRTQALSRDDEVENENDDSGIVLVVCKDERSCMQLEDAIEKGSQKDGQCLGFSASSEPQSLISQNLVTRKAGGRTSSEKEMQVIVDMREFMSSLPNVLHQKGMRIIPVTLEVGDYVLSPSICVERKSVMDLFQSFASGRLYHQVETMVRYYQIPVLLIEFAQDKSFSFQSASDIGDDVSPTNIISKLSLLVLHFPRLRLVWSRSVHATAEIFASLKANQDEPDESKAMRVGVPSEDGIVENDVRAENYNTSAIEFLRRLPGVTDSNYRALMDGCKSLAELALLPVDRLAELMGGQKAARTLREFLDAKCPTML